MNASLNVVGLARSLNVVALNNSRSKGSSIMRKEDGLYLCDSTGAYLYDSDNAQLLVNE